MSRKKDMVLIAAGLLVGLALSDPAGAAVQQLTATPSSQPIYVDGERVDLNAYGIEGNNYVMLRDVGKTVGFNVYWDAGHGAVQIETDKPYTGKAPAATETPATPGTATAGSGQDVEAICQEIIDRTNALRVQNGLPTLTVDPLLTQAAQVRAEEMAATGVYAHTRPDGTPRSTVTDCPYTGENIHRIFASGLQWSGRGLAELAVADWANSPSHLANILDTRVGSIGIGIARGTFSTGEECWYMTQWFLAEGEHISWVDEPITTK